MPFDERFRALDPDVWTPAYLPAWSSRAAAAASYSIEPDGLHLSLPGGHPPWCPDLHPDPLLRVSAVQSGNWSGPEGSPRGQQPFKDGLVVREAQPAAFGFVPHFGRVAVECRASIAPGSMFSAWMIGIEDEPERCGEICLVEVFGTAPRDIGCGIHPFRDPALREEFSALPLNIDVGEWHEYAVDWEPGRVEFRIYGERVRIAEQAPDYPMLLILAVFDFPAEVSDPAFVPELVVARVRQ